MSSATLSKVENWEQVRDEWVAEVERFMNRAEEWAKKQGWGTLQELKTIEESRLGSDEVPQLLIHDTFGRLLLTPEARFVMGADGLIYFIVIPSWDDHMIAKIGGEWSYLHDDADGPKSPWCESTFVEMTLQLTQRQ